MVIIKLTRVTNDLAGVEKILRFLQACLDVFAPYLIKPAPYLVARGQFALGRRYFRFFKFIDCFTQSYEAFCSLSFGPQSSTNVKPLSDSKGSDREIAHSPSPSLVESSSTILNVAKHAFMGMYLLLEACTILHAMNVHPTSWAPSLLISGNKFWFYSLLVSIFQSFLLLSSPFTPSNPAAAPSPAAPRPEKPALTEKADEAESAAAEAAAARAKHSAGRRRLKQRLLTDVCDLFIPGNVTGWIPTSTQTAGAAAVVSTLLASTEIWERVQQT